MTDVGSAERLARTTTRQPLMNATSNSNQTTRIKSPNTSNLFLIPELATILRKQDFELLVHTRELLDEILETLEVSSDPRTSKALKEGLRDVKNSRVRLYRDFVKELRSSHEL